VIRSVEFELVSGSLITIFLSGTITVLQSSGSVYVSDGHHNNGGWEVKGSYNDVVRKIKMAGA